MYKNYLIKFLQFVLLVSLLTGCSGESDSANTVVADDNNTVITDIVSIVVPTLESTTLSISENSLAGSTVGTVTITSTGDSNITLFSLTGTGSNLFSIDNDGVIAVAVGAVLDYETTTSYTLSSVATNGAGDSIEVDVTINIIDVDEPDTTPPTFLSTNIVFVIENRTDAITLVATDDSGSVIYSISGGTDAESFDINSTTGIVVFITEPNFETKQNYSFIAMASDASDNNVTQTVDITILDEDIQHNGTLYETVLSPYTQRVWLDRNLGASQVCTALDDTACYGDYYQWGRNFDGHEQKDSLAGYLQATDINNAGSGFLLDSGTNLYDWAYLLDANGSLRAINWSKIDGTSICPIGYRTPTITELEADTIDAGDNNNSAIFAGFLKFPSAGMRYYFNGELTLSGTYAMIWTSDVNASNSIIRGFDTTSSGQLDYYRTHGLSVRCIKD